MSSRPETPRSRARAPRPGSLGAPPAEKGISRYYRLYELLSGALREGAISPGSALPSEPSLCVQYGVSRTTVRRALERLELEGRICRRRGSGTYARSQTAPTRHRLELHALGDSLSALKARSSLFAPQTGPADVPDALRALGAGIGPSGYRLDTVRRDRTGPVEFTAAYLLDGAAERLRGSHVRASVMGLLERLGLPSLPVAWAIGAVPADQAAARALEVPLGTPLLRLRAVLADRGGRPTAVLESLCRSDRLRVRIAHAGRAAA